MKESEEKAERAKLLNTVDMAVSFSAMGRVFKKGSTDTIKNELYNCLEEFFSVIGYEDFRKQYEKFCKWFTRHIKTAKNSSSASWGHAAKIIDIVLKVCIYYCDLPDAKTAKKIKPWLNAAIDTKLLKFLKERNPSPSNKLANTHTIKDIDKRRYSLLQDLVRKDIEDSYEGSVTPVEYDDIKWRELHKRDL